MKQRYAQASVKQQGPAQPALLENCTPYHPQGNLLQSTMISVVTQHGALAGRACYKGRHRPRARTAILAVPSRVSSTLADLRSKWMMRLWCRWCSPRAISSAIRRPLVRRPWLRLL